MADPNEVAQEFVKFYYSTFDTNRSGLTALYKDNSMLSFEGQQYLGTNSVAEKLTSLPFQAVQHKITTLDAQPFPGGICVLVTGLLVVDGSENPLNFSQMFSLLQDGGSFYVYNDIFRLNYG
ncbi:nuclear transport factor 2 [Serendipita vermifera]|nr:nuclear transport factor 2 [Serendipita vermifera]